MSPDSVDILYNAAKDHCINLDLETTLPTPQTLESLSSELPMHLLKEFYEKTGKSVDPSLREMAQELVDFGEPIAFKGPPRVSPEEMRKLLDLGHMEKPKRKDPYLGNLIKKNKEDGKPDRAGFPWTELEDKRLTQEHKNRCDVSFIAHKHKRTEGSIYSRLEKLHLEDNPHRPAWTRPNNRGRI
jgi:hypothetical protein